MKNKFLILGVVLELIIISFLLVFFYKKTQNNVLGTVVSVNPISKDALIFTELDSFKHFYEPKPNTTEYVEVTWLSKKTEYTINSDSLNERFGYSTDKPSGTYRIITLGDSFTFGQFVNTFENYPERLEDLLNNNLECNNIKRFEVINLGVYGYDIAYTVERFKKRGQKYNPDLILWLIGDGNLTQINEYMIPRNRELVKNLEEAGTYTEIIRQGTFYPGWEEAREELINQLGEDTIFKYQVESFEKFKKTYDGLLIVSGFIQNKNKQFVKNLTDSRPKTIYYQSIPNIYNITGATHPDFHPSSLGHKIIAEDIFKYLTQNKIIPCN